MGLLWEIPSLRIGVTITIIAICKFVRNHQELYQNRNELTTKYAIHKPSMSIKIHNKLPEAINDEQQNNFKETSYK